MSKTCVSQEVHSHWVTEVEHKGYAELGEGKPVSREVRVTTSDRPNDGYSTSAYTLTVAGLREYGEWLVSVADSLSVAPKKRRRGRRS